MRGCTIEGCEGKHKAYGWCRTHYRRWAHRGGDPSVRAKMGPSRAETVTYSGAHERLRRERGTARDYWCEHCDNRAANWAYDHEDPAELVTVVLGRSHPYSVDPAHYFPLCRSCHSTFDIRLRRAA